MKNSVLGFFKPLSLMLWSIVLTALTFILGAGPLRALRISYGRWWFLLFVILSVGGLSAVQWWSLAIFLFVLALMTEIFVELEDHGHSLWNSGFFAVLITSLLIAGSFALWVAQVGNEWHAQVVAAVEKSIMPWNQMNLGISFSAEEATRRLPSLMVVVLVLTLVLSLVTERRFLFGHELPRRRYGFRLNRFQIPDGAIWVFIASMFLTFSAMASGATQVLAGNVLSVCVVLWFLQGLAVVARYYQIFRISWMWQAAGFILMALQPLILTVLGLADYWMDFRERFEKRAEQMKRETQN